jgi:50S ribosomal protein L16 3-hydroxylase
MQSVLLGSMSPRTFLARHWQKRARLVRGAIPGFEGFLDRSAFFALASRDAVESRLVMRDGRRWVLEHGPFPLAELRRLPARNWTLLIQGVNLHRREGAALLSRFDFIPHARLDDLMVSYAVPGGGVGPHFDSYDVFLLQGIGQRRWEVSRQTDLALVEAAPLKILRRFQPQQRWVLDPGDMLYLPPRYAHHGVAVTECATYSIGFRAPTYRELVSEFLARMSETIDVPGLYADPHLKPVRHPGKLGSDMIGAASAAVQRLRWTRGHVEDFLGCYLSEPKPTVFFSRRRRLGTSVLARAIARGGLALDAGSRMLYGTRAVYLNGEACRFPRGVPAVLRELADRRQLPPGAVPPLLAPLFQDWHASGFVHVGTTAPERSST